MDNRPGPRPAARGGKGKPRNMQAGRGRGGRGRGGAARGERRRPMFDGIPPLVVYTDGSCSNNGFDGAVAGYGVHYPPKENHGPIPSDMSGNVPPSLPQTNNVGELLAVIYAVRDLVERDRYDALDDELNQKLIIHSDSAYCVDGATLHIYKWDSNNYTLASGYEVRNRDMWEDLHSLMLERVGQYESTGREARFMDDVIEFRLIYREDNREADELAYEGRMMVAQRAQSISRGRGGRGRGRGRGGRGRGGQGRGSGRGHGRGGPRRA